VDKIFRKKPTKPWVKCKYNLPGSHVLITRGAYLHAATVGMRHWEEMSSA